MIEIKKHHIQNFTTEQIIKLLETMGFEVEFKNCQTESIKEQIQRRHSVALEQCLNPIRTAFSKVYWEGRYELCEELLRFIEEIEKDETNN
jgi:hypothetical protein